MITANDIIPLKDQEVTIHYKDGITETATVERPNGDGMFNFTISDLQDKVYLDGGRKRRRGIGSHKVTLEFNYSSHRMPLNKFLISKFIVFQFSNIILPFTNTKFVFEPTTAQKNWFSDLVVSPKDSDINPVPMGSTTLNFLSVEAVKYAEI